MDGDVKEAIRLLGVYTAGRFNPWDMAGSSKASCRAHVMSALCGQRMAQARSGVNALARALYTALGIAGSCEAERQDNLRAVCEHFQAAPNGWAMVDG